ncbi:MAG: HIT domain-containing protein [Candidatus Woesebacteria bacterium]
MTNCFICDRIQDIKNNKNPNFVCELETGYVILLGNKLWPGYTLFTCKIHACELHELPVDFKARYLEEMMTVSKYVWDIFQPKKLNYELLGNGEPHLHWHIVPRSVNEVEPYSKDPIWTYAKEERLARVADNELLPLVESFKSQIERLRQI